MDKPLMVATVYLFSKAGHSPLENPVVSARNIRNMLPSQEVIAETCSILESFGFDIVGRGVTISIAGSQSLFETTFDIRIQEAQSMLIVRHALTQELLSFFNHPRLESSVAGIQFQQKGTLL